MLPRYQNKAWIIWLGPCLPTKGDSASVTHNLHFGWMKLLEIKWSRRPRLRKTRVGPWKHIIYSTFQCWIPKLSGRHCVDILLSEAEWRLNRYRLWNLTFWNRTPKQIKWQKKWNWKVHAWQSVREGLGIAERVSYRDGGLSYGREQEITRTFSPGDQEGKGDDLVFNRRLQFFCGQSPAAAPNSITNITHFANSGRSCHNWSLWIKLWLDISDTSEKITSAWAAILTMSSASPPSLRHLLIMAGRKQHQSVKHLRNNLQ